MKDVVQDLGKELWCEPMHDVSRSAEAERRTNTSGVEWFVLDGRCADPFWARQDEIVRGPPEPHMPLRSSAIVSLLS